MAKWIFLNGSFVEEEEGYIHFKDLSFQRGYGVFDFFRLRGNEPLFLEDHLDRFYFSANGLHLPVPIDRKELTKAIFHLIEKNDMPNTGLRVSLTGGHSEDGFNIGKPTLVISQQNFLPPTDEQVSNGVRLLTYPYQRQLPYIKSIDYLTAIWLQPKRKEKGADDILYHQNGFISECPRSNFFLLTGENKLVTPTENALAGITRKKVLQLAKEYVRVEERPVSIEELKTANEAFITSTTKQILPVAQIDDIVFPERTLSLRLLQLFRSAYSTK